MGLDNSGSTSAELQKLRQTTPSFSIRNTTASVTKAAKVSTVEMGWLYCFMSNLITILEYSPLGKFFDGPQFAPKPSPTYYHGAAGDYRLSLLVLQAADGRGPHALIWDQLDKTLISLVIEAAVSPSGYLRNVPIIDGGVMTAMLNIEHHPAKPDQPDGVAKTS
ncbi:MAG: hypothetical protein L6R40_001960 [Gallowayella cf. fulva]|nr:MAG: hypothetical protein L6R40_001960 [Xanthomendoza cf. fulva]